MESMNITLAKYIKDEDGDNKNCGIKATIDGKNLCVPLDSANTHYQEIQKWVAKGNKIEDAD
tara:strand:+ start:170 stop:355 length:186 start_codon:yes stop_codon:yes gene_type:complete